MSDKATAPEKSVMQKDLETVKANILKALPVMGRAMITGLVNDIFGFLTKVVARQDALEKKLEALSRQ